MVTKILVVDDESVTRRVVIHALKAINIEAVGAADGQQAIQLASENAFALAIIDLNLPDIDGFEVVRRLKLLDSMRNIPIIMFTARNQPGDEANALKAGASGFLFKPFSTQELRDLVQAQLQNR